MRRLLVPLLAASLFGGTLAATATEHDRCPADVLAVRGDNPSYAAVAAKLATSAAAHDVPVQVLKAIAFRESVWRQFRDDRRPLISTDAVCGIGIMQITLGDRTDGVRLASDYAYNVDEGAKILAEKWAVGLNQTWPQPEGYAPDDRNVLENWYASICRYNGCLGGGADQVYARPVARIVRSPFQSEVPGDLAVHMPPGGFTTPHDADSTYVFPGGFQAQHSPTQQFVFYDGSTGQVTKTVPAPTHLADAAPGTGYPAGTYGPNGRNVSCVDCAYWRPAEGAGIAGWAHWTNSVVGANEARTYWKPPRGGQYDVRAFVPAIGAEPLARATYHFGTATQTVDQQAAKGTWVSLGRRTLATTSPVWLGDASDVAGVKIAADAMHFKAVTSLALTSSASAVTYGYPATLTIRLSQASGPGLPGYPVQLSKRKAGVLGWTPVGTYTTGTDGRVAVKATPTANTYYRATFAGDPTAGAAPGAVRRVDVKPRVRATLSDSSVRRGTAVKVSTTVAPSHAGQRVTLQRYYSGAWRNVVSATLGSTSAASFPVRWSAPGTFYYRVYKPADSDHVAGYSARLTLKVT